VSQKTCTTGTGCRTIQSEAQLSPGDMDQFQKIFWDLFRQNIITLGNREDPNSAFPFYHVTNSGRKLLETDGSCFFHYLMSYEKTIRENISGIDDLTVTYAKEAMQAFIVGCRLPSSVMLGVALEYSLDALYEKVSRNEEYARHFHSVPKEKTALGKFNKFRQKLIDKKHNLSEKLNIDLDTDLDMILFMLRNYRTGSGQPQENVLSREQCYVNLQLFIPCCKRIYALTEFFGKQGVHKD
jgi:hypothetical protein